MCIKVLQKIPTGCRTIDKILEGGIHSKTISLIYGEAETGKTTLAMQCAVNCAKKGYKTLFVDCDGTFSALRLSQIASESFKEIADLVILAKPNNFREQATLIDQLTNLIAKNFGLVVIDTITSLYRAKIAESPEKAFDLNRELNRQMALLAQNAKTQKVAVLVTSQVRSVFNDTYVRVEPVATRVLKFWAETIIEMKPTEIPQEIRAILEKNPIKDKKPQLVTCHLKIGKTGIHEYLPH
ncbi:MAG: ATPase domain-containing protein [Candidatus Bathyarchaeota archaeon]|jgi:DNA repair protein RadB|nr:AAA family ATPase [Candidatus Bathyarchaeota archaeon A05DMB-5]MDH7557060.1 ATPase domain-containing protein [Candidatus Bathyarchaeota archaeon]